MFIKHPNGKELINLSGFQRITKSDDGRYVEFHNEMDQEEDAGDFRIKFSTAEKRDAWFNKVCKRTHACTDTLNTDTCGSTARPVSSAARVN